jgi:ABC-2 type transport system permease protein
VELKLFLREPITVVFTLALPPLVLYVLSEVFGNTPDTEGGIYRGVGAVNYYVPAYFGLVAAALGIIGLPVHLASYRERGVLRRFQAARVPVRALLASQVAVMVVGMVTGSAILLGLAKLTYDVRLPASWPGVLFASALGVAMFGAIGAFLGAAMPTARAAQGIGILLWFTMQMLCGGGPPTEVLSDTLNRVGDFLPLRHLIVALQDPWLGYGVNWFETAVLAAITVVAAGLASVFLRRRS